MREDKEATDITNDTGGVLLDKISQILNTKYKKS